MKNRKRDRIKKAIATMACIALVVGLLPAPALADVDSPATPEQPAPDAAPAIVEEAGSQVTISTAANPANGGTVTGAGKYATGQTIKLKAIPEEGYHFVNWTENGQVVSTKVEWDDFLVQDDDKLLVANFELDTHVVNATADPEAGGSATGGGTYTYGKMCTVVALPNMGYHFVNWTEDGTPVSTDASYSFTVTGARNLVAHFDLDTFTVSLTAHPENGGTVEGARTYQYGSSAPCIATPSTGYHFVNWTENGSQVSADATYEFDATADRTLVAHFELDTFNVSATTDPEVGGTVSGGGTFTYGQKATLTAEPSEGYVFDYWSTEADLETSLCKTEEYEFNVTGSQQYVAHFKKILIVEPDGKQLQGRTYTGSPITFPISVYLEGVDEALVEGANYIAEFTANMNVGKGKVVVELTSPRKGTATATFDIVAADISTAKVEVADQVYDGTELTPVPTVTWDKKTIGADDYTATYADNVRAGTATVTVTGKHNFAASSKASGTFKIAERPVTITADSATREYDGKPLVADGFTSEGLAEGDRIASAKVEGSQTDAGSSANTVSSAKIVNAAGEDVTDCYDIAYKPGTLTVKPAKAKITVASASKVEGEADPTFTGTVEGLIADGDLGKVKYKRTNSDEAPGTYEGVITATYTANANYDVAVKNGDFTIKEKGTYEAVSGSGSTWTKGSTEALTFPFKRAADDEMTFDLFKGVEVDGKVVPEKDASGKANWTAKKGSLILSLQPSFLETLSEGDHTVKAIFDDGAGEATFKVAAAKPSPAKGTSAKTGDTLPLFALMITLMLSAAVLAVSRRKLRVVQLEHREKQVR